MNKGQTKLHSWYETFTNIAVGYMINLCAQLIIFPAYNMHITLTQQIEIGLIFTVISVCRQYCLRRWFNKWMVSLWQKA